MKQRQDNRNAYPFHTQEPATYSAAHVARMMAAREAHQARAARERRKERIAMLAYNGIIIAMLLVFFAYITR